MRGEKTTAWTRHFIEGITPACAGRRTLNKEVIDRYEDHPRMRGEKVDVGASSVLRGGSPPHARGEVKQ